MKWTARIRAAEAISATTRLVVFEPAQPITFVGGQCIVVDTGRVRDGRPVRRAYSLLNPDTGGAELEIAVEHVPVGGVSTYVHDAPVGAEMTLTGPWSKFVPRDDATGRAVVVATDTGITAALGLITGQRFARHLPRATLIWLRTSPTYFLGDARVRARIPAACGDVRIVDAPPIGHPERAALARSLVAPLLAGGVDQAFATGDGDITYPLLADFVAAGVPVTRDNLETFFNMPRRTS